MEEKIKQFGEVVGSVWRHIQTLKVEREVSAHLHIYLTSLNIVKTMPVSKARCDLSFSRMNLSMSPPTTSLQIDHLSTSLFIKSEGFLFLSSFMMNTHMWRKDFWVAEGMLKRPLLDNGGGWRRKYYILKILWNTMLHDIWQLEYQTQKRHPLVSNSKE
jgi:hypothetical protein